MIEIRLSDADRKRFGVSEVVTYDPTRMTLREVRHMRAQTIFDPFTLDDALAKGGDLEAAAACVWVALRQAEVEVPPFADFDLEILRAALKAVNSPEAQAPLEAETTGPVATTTSSTTATST